MDRVIAYRISFPSGFCRQGSCANFPTISVSQPCSDSNTCAGAETANEYPPSCGGLSGVQPTCGGESTFCYSVDGAGNGASPICASGLCRDFQCTSLAPLGAGETCISNGQCQGRLYCNGICSDAGLSCTADDASATGSTTQCFSGKHPNDTIGGHTLTYRSTSSPQASADKVRARPFP
jgi:hypothetical protein